MESNSSRQSEVTRRITGSFGPLAVALALAHGAVELPAASYGEQIEADWLMQAESWRKAHGLTPSGVPTYADAAGAVDGVKNGKYAFHTDKEPNPWWRVDLGRVTPIARIVVYNRLDYPPGLHNADNLVIVTSNDGENWTPCYENRGQHFGGVMGAKPLDVRFNAEAVRARFVQLQIPSSEPIWFHLDEVEIYGPEDLEKNLALGRPADQSSVSRWSTVKTPLRETEPAAYPIEETIQRGRLLAADLRKMGVNTHRGERELAQAAACLAELAADAPEEARRALYLRARRVVRRLAFSNPLLDFDQLLFVKRFTQETYPDVCLNHMPWVSRPGGDICMLTLKGPEEEPGVRNLLNGALGPGHVHGADLWWGADRVVFGYAKAKSEKPPEGWLDRTSNYRLRRTEEPTHLFEIGIDGKGLRQVTDGQWSDLDPTYAPNGDIVFVSERCGCSLQCNEYDKDETSCNLYVCRPDGSAIRRMSVSKDGDYLPHCLDDGVIAYTRWEYQERKWANIQSIWTIRPDGTGADALFAQHLNDPWALEDVRSIPGAGGAKLVAVATGHHTLAAGPVVVIATGVGMNTPDAIRIVTPGVRPPEGGMSGTPADQGGVVDHLGFYMTPWALSESYFLASYNYGAQTDPTGYALYLIDVFGVKELIYRDPTISCFVPIPLRPRPRPPLLPDTTDRRLDYAVCCVSNASSGADGVDPKSARFIRVAHRLQWPYDNKYGGQRYAEKATPNNWTPVRILGETPIKEDGSAHFKVPADTPVYFQLLDENHMELRRMRSFISFQPGERRSCVGCHETRGAAPPHQFPTAWLREPAELAPPPWGDRPLSFLRDVQPIFDKHCVQCHSGLRPAGGLDFFGGLTAHGPIPGYGLNRAFDTIISEKLVSWSDVQGDASVTQPLDFGSHRSKLVDVLRRGACSKRAKLSDDDWLRLVAWIDANAPYHDGFVNKRQENPPYGLPNDKPLIAAITQVHETRCAPCHKAAEVSRADWIDIHNPQQSLFLTAPLATTPIGKSELSTRKCRQATYQDREDPDYQTLLKLVSAAVQKAWDYPRRDLETLKKRSHHASLQAPLRGAQSPKPSRPPLSKLENSSRTGRSTPNVSATRS